MISDQLCEYYGLITHLDEQVGRIVKSVQESHHADNTIIIYTADHGLAMGSHGLLGKQNIYEQSMSSPLIINGKGILKGTSNSFTYVHDLYATICHFAKIPTPAGVTSQNLSPLIQGKKEKLRDSLFLPFLRLIPQVKSLFFFCDNVAAQNRKINIQRLLQYWFPVRRLMES